MKIESFPQPAPTTHTKEEIESVKKVSKHFEALFINHMISEMRKTVTNGGLIPEGHAEKIYRGLLDQQYADQISETERLGLSTLVSDYLLKKWGKNYESD